MVWNSIFNGRLTRPRRRKQDGINMPRGNYDVAHDDSGAVQAIILLLLIIRVYMWAYIILHTRYYYYEYAHIEIRVRACVRATPDRAATELYEGWMQPPGPRCSAYTPAVPNILRSRAQNLAHGGTAGSDSTTIFQLFNAKAQRKSIIKAVSCWHEIVRCRVRNGNIYLPTR